MASVLENIIRANDDLLAVKDAVVATGVEIPNGTPSSLYADKIAEVYEKGKSEGGGGDITTAYNEGYKQGKTDEKKAFWGGFQQNGMRKDYQNALYGVGWNDDIYNPQYDFLDLTAANNMFYNSPITDTKVKIALTGGTLKKNATANYMFNASKIENIVELEVNEYTAFLHLFRQCSNLTHCIITGTIAQNGLDFSACSLLDKPSITSVINSASTTATITVTLSLKAVNKAFETSEGVNDGSTSEEWLALIGAKQNVTITLA